MLAGRGRERLHSISESWPAPNLGQRFSHLGHLQTPDQATQILRMRNFVLRLWRQGDERNSACFIDRLYLGQVFQFAGGHRLDAEFFLRPERFSSGEGRDVTQSFLYEWGPWRVLHRLHHRKRFQILNAKATLINYRPGKVGDITDGLLHRRLQGSPGIAGWQQIAVNLQGIWKRRGEDILELRRRVEPVTHLLQRAGRHIGELQTYLLGMSAPSDLSFGLNANVCIG